MGGSQGGAVGGTEGGAGFSLRGQAGVEIAKAEIDALAVADVLREVYNTEVAGEIEVLVRPGNGRKSPSR